MEENYLCLTAYCITTFTVLFPTNNIFQSFYFIVAIVAFWYVLYVPRICSEGSFSTAQNVNVGL